MRVLGVDPGTATTGYGIVEETEREVRALAYGVITTPPGQPLPQRLQTIYRELQRLIQEWQPDEAAVEELYFNVNVRTALSVGQARGVVLLALADAGLPVTEYGPGEVKQALTGYGGAEKRQMQEMVRMLLGLKKPPSPDDAADALAVAICHLHSARMRGMVER
ncbi:MAG: crossover junction endodeoxyribonuclease RuvC [Anaerolineae bacterium]|nr:crossover junction endodeoxyribonuclease RuvC [Anaerolineae bacterium]MCX8066616.1 crossover junction endodeoxyribonuclease RuvC [Anaerolineae bacterium]MDW7991081.1 crossover junction endodeoxyribonuclease RuvC [Anaerolineae bacterium]